MCRSSLHLSTKKSIKGLKLTQQCLRKKKSNLSFFKYLFGYRNIALNLSFSARNPPRIKCKNAPIVLCEIHHSTADCRLVHSLTFVTPLRTWRKRGRFLCLTVITTSRGCRMRPSPSNSISRLEGSGPPSLHSSLTFSSGRGCPCQQSGLQLPQGPACQPRRNFLRSGHVTQPPGFS